MNPVELRRLLTYLQYRLDRGAVSFRVRREMMLQIVAALEIAQKALQERRK